MMWLARCKVLSKCLHGDTGENRKKVTKSKHIKKCWHLCQDLFFDLCRWNIKIPQVVTWEPV
jgi:hypothetical protein